MKQSVPKATVAGGRHACHQRCMVSDPYLYAILPNFYKSSLRFKDEKRSLKKVSESHTTRLTAARFRAHGRINIYYHSKILTNLLAFEKYWTKPSLRKQLTFGDATTAFPAKWRLRNERRNSIFPYLVGASDWLNEISHTARKPEALPRSG